MQKITNRSIFTILFVLYFSVNVYAELKLLSVVFRHGDRAPDDNGLEIYPKDPYKDYDFEPMELGGLTNRGKLREYELGEHLRRVYGHFLGDTYHPSEVKARSTNSDRTKMSLQLVLAALYAPNDVQTWSEKLDWQPIPATYVPKLDDNLMLPEECPKYLRAREKVEQSPVFQEKLKMYDRFMARLRELTGRNIRDSNDMYFLYHALMAERSMGLKLPLWTKNMFPRGRLLGGINLEYEIFSYNDEMRRLNGGMLLRKFVDDMDDYRSDELDNRQKLFIYSGHETNVAAVLQALGVYTPHAPAYSSSVFVELHEEDGEYYVKVKYYKGIPNVHEEMSVPGCGKKCTLSQFREALKNVIPSDEDTVCDKRSLRSPVTRKMLPIKVSPNILVQIEDELVKEDKIKNKLH